MAGLGPWGQRVPRASNPEPATKDEQQKACESCAAVLAYSPGTERILCNYCGAENTIEVVDVEIRENDLTPVLRELANEAPQEASITVTCPSCNAEFTFDGTLHAGDCIYCNTHIVADTGINRHVKPQAILPFALNEEEARREVNGWLEDLWFAPSKLAKHARTSKQIVGVYMPFWTYDSHTHTEFQGQRGDVYYEQQRVAVRVNGRTQYQTRSVQKVRWRPVSGRTERFFDDVLATGSNMLPEDMIEGIEPWDLQEAKPYMSDFLRGFKSEAYHRGLAASYPVAKAKMHNVIQGDVRARIGGDMQRIHHMAIDHRSPTFKHVLLPVWLASFHFGSKHYHFVVNARNGQVRGDRPYSPWKIGFAVVAGLLVFGAIAAVAAVS